MARRRNQNEVIEDAFADLEVEKQAALLAVLNGLHRQKKRQGAALADTTEDPEDLPLLPKEKEDETV
jgi:hypothetical protein